MKEETQVPAADAGRGLSEGLGPLPTIPPGETDAEFVAQIEATHCRPLTPPERMPQYIRDELPDELAAHRLQAWADARVAAERARFLRLIARHCEDACVAAVLEDSVRLGLDVGPNAELTGNPGSYCK
jgi:hypothetical protein